MERSGQSVPVLWGRRSLGSTELPVSNPQELEARGGRTRTVEPLQQHDPIDRTHHEDGVDPDVVAWVVRSESLEEEMRAIAKAIIQRAAAADDPLVAALTAAENAMSAAFELWEQDQAAYREAYTAAIRQALTDRGLMVEVEVVEACGEWEWDPLIDELHEYARKNAPLPMTGAAPDWTNGTPADALHRAGLTYLARAQATTR